jgi:Uncharacterized conserved protein
MSDRGWRVGVVIDDGASEEQAHKLAQVLAGHLGGPPAMLAGLVGEVLGMERLPVDYVDEGRRHRVKVGEAIDMEIEDFVAPQFGPDGPVSKLVGMAHPANSELTVASALRSRVNLFGLSFDNTGKNGHSAPFSWAA